MNPFEAINRTPHQEVMDKSEADELRQNVLGPALSLPTVEVEIIARAR